MFKRFFSWWGTCLLAIGLMGLLPGMAAISLAAGQAADATEEVYESPEGFLAGVFGTSLPEPELLWITKDRRQVVEDILSHPYGGLRTRYWRQGGRTAWILEEIGKTRPITTGFVVEEGRLVTVKVLVYRESHGWEVRYPFFTDQFKDSRLAGGNRLDRTIDGISGATLSVNALTRLARLALYFHGQVMAADSGSP